MAKIKGWNKIQENKSKNLILYKSNQDIYVQVMYKDWIPEWEVSIGKEFPSRIGKRFKTKEQALKFAMNYMKSHPGVKNYYAIQDRVIYKGEPYVVADNRDGLNLWGGKSGTQIQTAIDPSDVSPDYNRGRY